MLAKGTRIDLLANKLVVIARRPAEPLDLVATSILRRLRDGRMALGDPAHVPAGRYARDALMAIGLWPALRRRLAFTAHVREVVVLVARGEAPLGVSYLSDALASDRVGVVATFAEQSHGPIVYPLAIIDAQDGAPARALHGFLVGPKVRAIYLKYGFQVRG